MEMKFLLSPRIKGREIAWRYGRGNMKAYLKRLPTLKLSPAATSLHFAVVIFLSLSFSSLVFADDLILPITGCPMSHCDNHISGNVRLSLPLSFGGLSLVSHDGLSAGSGPGLGCVSNGTGGTVACSLNGRFGANLIVYDGDGHRKWSSNLFDANANSSAPIIDTDGGVIAADDKILVRFDPRGKVVWQTRTPGGIPISPVVVQQNVILIATVNGPITAYSFADGSLLGTLLMKDPDGSVYGTINTPSVNGDAIYVSQQKLDDSQTGRLVKIAVQRGGTPVLSVVWSFTFGAPSGASPHYNPQTNTIYFDGASPSPGGSGPPILFAVADAGTAPQLKWSVPLPAKILAAVVQDPRGGVWAFSQGVQYLWRFNEADGTILQTVDVNALIGRSSQTIHGPSSAMVITPGAVMMVGAATVMGAGPSYLAAIDLNDSAGSLTWKYKVADFTIGDVVFGQFPIVINGSGRPRVVFTTRETGAYFLSTVP